MLNYLGVKCHYACTLLSNGSAKKINHVWRDIESKACILWRGGKREGERENANMAIVIQLIK